MIKKDMQIEVTTKMVEGYKVMTKYEGEWVICENTMDVVDTINEMSEPIITTKNKTIYIEDAQDEWMDEEI